MDFDLRSEVYGAALYMQLKKILAGFEAEAGLAEGSGYFLGLNYPGTVIA